MSTYKTALFATDFAEDSYEIAQRAKTISEAFQAELHIVHIVTSMPEYSIGYIMAPDIEQRMKEEAHIALTKMREALNLPCDRQSLAVGSPKTLILKKAADIKADLVIVGSHGHHGWDLLLGSTAGSIVHHADCDVIVLKSHK